MQHYKQLVVLNKTLNKIVNNTFENYISILNYNYVYISKRAVMS